MSQPSPLRAPSWSRRPRSRLGRVMLALFVVLASVVASIPMSSVALAGPKAVFTEVDVPEGEQAKKQLKQLRRMLDQAASKADLGKGRGKVELTARLVELRSEERDGVLRVRCTLVGRVKGARGARSHLTFGGHPSKQKELEAKVLGMVAEGLVTRLAEIAREQLASEASEAGSD